MLQRCRGGLVCLPGAAGTVQEIFQAATGNYYAASADRIAPMVLVDRAYWSEHLPAWPLLQRLAADKAMSERIHLVDEPGEVIALLID